MQPVQPHFESCVWADAGAVGDGGGAEFYVGAGEGFHVGVVGGDGGGDVHVRLGFHVGFVEGH